MALPMAVFVSASALGHSALAAGGAGSWVLNFDGDKLAGRMADVDRDLVSVRRADSHVIGLQQLVVAASGPDGPGIVARLSKRVLDTGGNIELSRMARLAGEFSILMLVTFDVTTARKAEQLRNSLLQIEGLQVNTRWISDEQLKQARPSPKFRKILLRGVDNPGLVYNLTEYLSSHGINIESLETYNQEAPTPGGKLFMMEGVVAMPVGLSVAAFVHNLDTLQATLRAEIKISDLPNPVHDKIATPVEESS